MSADAVTESLTHPNPHTRDQALHWLWEETKIQTHYADLCARLAANAYGWAHSGEKSAKTLMEHQHSIHHVADAVPGDLVFWRYGDDYHVATLARHHGFVYSNDVKAEGQVDLVAIATVNGWLDMKPHGASVPYFPHGTR